MEPERQAADLRQLQLIWGALVAGVAAMTLALGGLVVSGAGNSLEPDAAALFFYVTAAVSIGAIAVAFTLQRRLTERLPTRGTYEEAINDVRVTGILSMALMEGSALLAAVAAFVTGQLVNLLFVLPFFGFAALFFPTATRFAYLMEGWRRR